jgi:hypothetical protein
MYLQKVIKEKKGNLEGPRRKEPDPEPLVRYTNPKIRIRTYQNGTDPEHCCLYNQNENMPIKIFWLNEGP